MAYESYNIHLSNVPSSFKEYYTNYHKEIADEMFYKSTTVQDVLHEGEETKVRVVDVFSNETPARRMKNYQKIIFNDTDYGVNYGDVFEFAGEKWLCVDISDNATIFTTCLVTKCNNRLNLYKDGELHEIPISIETSATTGALTTQINQYVEEPDEEVVVRVANNKITRTIKRGQIYKIGQHNWRVTSLNDILENGLIAIKFEYSQEEEPAYDFEVILSNEEIELEENSTYQIDATVEVNGEKVQPTPQLKYDSSNNDIATVDKDGLVTTGEELGEVEITVSLESDETVNAELKVYVVEESSSSYSLSIEGNDSIIVDESQEYVASLKESGSVIEDVTFDFWLTNTSGESTDYAEIVEQDDSLVVIEGLSKGEVQLWAKSLDEEVDIENYKTIKIDTLF